MITKYKSIAITTVAICLIQLSLNAIVEIETKIDDLTVTDIPNDDGTGLTLSWTPLPTENRIIEYRVYRGVSPDTLFHIGSIEVDPVVGVASPKLYFTDSGFSEFINIYSPAKLKKEEQQNPNSPLYRKIPRDHKVYGNYLQDFTLLAMIPNKEFYYKSKPVVKNEPDREVYSGLYFRQLDGILSSLIPGKEYYYSVLAVDQKRKFLPHSSIISGTPYANPPEQPLSFGASIIKDKQQILVEWNDPTIRGYINTRNFYIITPDKLNEMQRYIDSERQGKNPAKLILATNIAYPNLQVIESINGSIELLDSNTPLTPNWDNPDNYAFVMSYIDYENNEVFSEITPARVFNSADLPTIPNYQIGDKPNDKGDYNELTFGKPLTFITQASFANEKKTQLSLNYEYIDNRINQIRTIEFKFYDQNDNLIYTVDEFLPEKRIKIKIPHQKTVSEGIKVTIRPTYTNAEDNGQYLFNQSFNYNDELGIFEYGELMFEDEILSDYSYYVYRKSASEPNFSLARFMSAFTRSYDDSVPYETTTYKILSSVEDNGLLLFDSSITLCYDNTKETYITTNIYGQEIAGDIEYYKNNIRGIEEELHAANVEEKPLLELQLEHYKERLWMETEHPVLAEINKVVNSRKRMKELAKINEHNSRSYQYIFAKTDRNGLFSIDEIYQRDDNTHFTPISNWINREQIPALIASLVFGLIVFIMIRRSLKGGDMYIRPIAGLEEIDNAIGRATEMGRPVLFVPGFGYIEETATLAGLSILGNVAKKTAEYDTRIIVPIADYIVLPIAMETVKESHVSVGRPDSYNRDDVFYVAGDQFAIVAAVNGVMIRQKTAAHFYLGVFNAEALIMTEVGNSQGAIQIAGSDSTTQIPFFITTCDYTLIGEELYGASAYLSREPMILGTLKAQDYAKFIVIVLIVLGTLLSTFKVTAFIRAFPTQ